MRHRHFYSCTARENDINLNIYMSYKNDSILKFVPE